MGRPCAFAIAIAIGCMWSRDRPWIDPLKLLRACVLLLLLLLQFLATYLELELNLMVHWNGGGFA